jgi:hypothetical protein
MRITTFDPIKYKEIEREVYRCCLRIFRKMWPSRSRLKGELKQRNTGVAKNSAFHVI